MDTFLQILGVGMVIVLVMVFLSRRGVEARPIQSPVLGFLDLTNGADAVLMEADRAAIGPLFSSMAEASAESLRCDVLFLYCKVDAEGSVPGSDGDVRDWIRDTGAKVVVVASENEGDRYVAIMKEKRTDGFANLAMTIDRRGEKFGSFYRQLFAKMFDGIPMPMAWVQLAPQVPGLDHLDGPVTVMVCERGPVTFEQGAGV